MQNITREMRGIPLFLLQEYLLEMGGTLQDKNTVIGAGWNAQLISMEPFRLGSLAIGQVRVEIQIEDDKLMDFLDTFSKKTLRAGG
jgi:hypothetical protein